MQHTDERSTLQTSRLDLDDGARHNSGMTFCAWCKGAFDAIDARQLYCSKKCRQAAFRLRSRVTIAASNDRPFRFAYADPPYIGRAKRYYGNEPTFAGEVDHAALIASLEASCYDGWALSCAADSLRALLPMCPESVQVCPWVKPGAAPPASRGPHNKWEALLVVGGRKEPPGKPDWLRAQPARFGGQLPGRKPIAFIAFLWDMLGARAGDTLEDLFPGTGIVGRAWSMLSAAESDDTSRAALDHTTERDTSSNYFDHNA